MTNKEKAHLIISDMQIPYQDDNLFNLFMNEVSKESYTSVTIIGDFMDFPGPSMWSKGTVAEYSNNLQEQIGAGRKILNTLSYTFGRGIWFHKGNHEERIERYVAKYAPALYTLSDIKLENLLCFSDFGVNLADNYRVLCPGVVTTHGHLGPLNKVAGLTALKLADIVNASVVCGHTHRLGIVYRSDGVPGLNTGRTLFGMEVGHMMDLTKVTYVKTGSMNWQAGYGIVRETVNGAVQPEIHRLG